MLAYSSFDEFLADGSAGDVDEVMIGGVIYRQRQSQPQHQDFRYQDGDGDWWSPDYFVVVVAGQSNMVGAGTGGDLTTDPDVMVYNPETGQIEPWRYPNARNNLYIPFANDIAQSMGRPVLVVQGAVSGSRIDSWLETGSGVNWDALDADVRAALAQVGQDHVDSFLWHQGEGDYPLAPTTYAALLTAFIAQVRGADWAGESMAILVGELSREGVNSAQNVALQQLEQSLSGDALLRFVSSVGLTAFDTVGVHFDGESLVAFGHRFFDALRDILEGTPVPADTAPYLDVKPGAPVTLVMHEGETLHLSADLFFSDAEGDALWLYGALGRRAPYFLDGDGGDLVLRPGYDATGTHTLYVYASDGQLDGPRFALTLTVLDAQPGASIGTNTFGRLLSSWATAEEAMAAITASRGLDVLSAAAMPSDHALEVTRDNLTIRGGAGVFGTLALAPAILRVTLAGEAGFAVEGNGLANYLTGNAGNNVMRGGAGNDRAYGGVGDDLLQGDGGADQLYGGDGDDGLLGGAGDDKLYGGLGGDRLEGAAGRDQCYGGAGADTFVFTVGDGACYVQDFVAEEDRIEIAGRAGIDSVDSFLSAATVQSFATSTTWGLRLTIGGDQIVLYHVALADLTPDTMVFA